MSSPPVVDVDDTARRFAVDPANNVVLEASAGTGKTTVLVQRYINLLRAGVEPANILAITFTRKAATEMRERIVHDLRAAAGISEFDRARWVALRDRLGEISISTIDAFCLSLLREFPLEADLDPGFDLADETEVPRFVEESLDRSMRIFARLAESDEDIALVLAQLGSSRTRAGLASLLDRRIVAWDALNRFLARGPEDLTALSVCRRAAAALRSALDSVPGGLPRMLAEGPSRHPRYQLLLREMSRLETIESARPSEIRAVLDRVSLHFLTQEGTARKGGAIPPYNVGHWVTGDAAKRHRDAVFAIAPRVEQVLRQFARDFNVVLARGIRRMFAVSLEQYRRTLAARAVLDFSDVLQRALELLRRMDEFSQSRYRLESRYHHVLVDEFQDTSRAQWELVSLLIQSWGEGLGLASNPSIFIVGDRKQSIYRFRDAEVAVLQEAGRYIDALRPDGGARQSIARSFRAVPELLEFVNELCTDMSLPAARADAFAYRDIDRFPAISARDTAPAPALGIAVAEDPTACAAAVADEIARILSEDEVRDKRSGVSRRARAGDIAILFRSRTSHREFEQELAARNIPTYVYKGLGFFDSDEIKDATALLRFLAQPQSDLRAAAFLRSRFVRLSDSGLARLAPRLASAITGPCRDISTLDDEDRLVLEHVRNAVPGWLQLVDRIPPADLFERILPDAAYAFELRGRRRQQAWENLKKMRGLIRRVQNRGYATLARIADHIDSLSAGDESNAVLEAIDAVNLMTVHASKGLEFPIVFIVNMARGAGGLPRPVRVITDGESAVPSVSVSPFMSETDELERERDQHETRRLVYVALTRARDRLYLSSSLKDGALQGGRGGLADVLPASMRGVFERAALDGADTVTWTSAAGREFAWRVCRPGGSASAPRLPDPPDPVGVLDPPAPSAETIRLSASEWLRLGYPDDEGSGDGGSPRDLLVGRLVHRLFQSPPSYDADATEYARARLRVEEQSADDLDALVASAVAIWRRMRDRPEVAAVLNGACVLAEVPFSLRLDPERDGAIVRGTIDCLAIGADGSVTVLEYKTGRPRPVHQAQLNLYLQAARSLFPTARVDGRLVYDGGDDNSVLRNPTLFDCW